MCDLGRIHLVTKRDGAVRRVVAPLPALPALDRRAWGALLLLLAASAVLLARRRIAAA